jgi:hypothetical protein
LRQLPSALSRIRCRPACEPCGQEGFFRCITGRSCSPTAYTFKNWVLRARTKGNLEIVSIGFIREIRGFARWASEQDSTQVQVVSVALVIKSQRVPERVNFRPTRACRRCHARDWSIHGWYHWLIRVTRRGRCHASRVARGVWSHAWHARAWRCDCCWVNAWDHARGLTHSVGVQVDDGWWEH